MTDDEYRTHVYTEFANLRAGLRQAMKERDGWRRSADAAGIARREAEKERDEARAERDAVTAIARSLIEDFELEAGIGTAAKEAQALGGEWLQGRELGRKTCDLAALTEPLLKLHRRAISHDL